MLSNVYGSKHNKHFLHTYLLTEFVHIIYLDYIVKTILIFILIILKIFLPHKSCHSRI